MKSLIIIICLACFGSLFSTNTSKNIPPSQIALKGKLAGNGLMRNIPPIEAYQNAFEVLLVFNSNLGSLNVEVVDDLGFTVFQTTVNATAGSNLTIYTNALEGGEYSIHICNGSNECAEGSFVIEEEDE